MILVSGGTGMLGAHLLWHLASEGRAVRALYRSQRKLKSVLSFFKTRGNTALFETIDWYQADILDLPELEIAFEGIDTVFHCAAMVSFDANEKQNMLRVNVIGTANMVNLALSQGVDSFCHVSSIAALGSAIGKEPITEDNEWDPAAFRSFYSHTKYLSELEVWRGEQEGLNVSIVNPSVIIGGYFWDNSSSKFFEAIYKGMLFYPKGATGFVAIDDVCEVMIALVNQRVYGKRYIVNGENWSYKKFFDTLALGLKVKGPQRPISKQLLILLSRLDSFASIVFGKKQKLSKASAISSSTRKSYSSAQLQKDLDFKFSSLELALDHLAQNYLAHLQIKK